MKNFKTIWIMTLFVLVLSLNVLADQSAHGSIPSTNSGADPSLYGAKITPLWNITLNSIQTFGSTASSFEIRNGTNHTLIAGSCSSNNCNLNFNLTTDKSSSMGYYLFVSQAIINYTNGGGLNTSNNALNWNFRYYVSGLGNLVSDLGNGIINIKSVNYTNLTSSPPPALTNDSFIVFQGQTPSNATTQYYLVNANVTIMTNATFFGGTVNTTIYLYNATALYRTASKTETNQTSLFNTTFTNLPIGTYRFNATANNNTHTNRTTQITFFIYEFTPASFITPINNQNNSNSSLFISWNTSTTNPNVSTYFIYNLSLYNASGFIRTLTTTTITSFNWNGFYDLNLSIGNHTLNLTTFDFKNNSLNQITVFNQQTNALLNITAKKLLTNATINDFNITMTSTTGSSVHKNTTTGIVLMDYIKGTTYNLTIKSPFYASNNTLFTSNNTYSNLQFMLYGFNSLLIYFYDELTQTLMINKTVYFELISDIFAGNYTATNGTLNLELLDPEIYIARYDSAGYVERFYEFTITDDSAQILNLYLLNSTVADEVTITVLDEDTLALEGAIVKALKYDITTNSYITVEIGSTNIDGKVVMDLTLADEYYKFIVLYNGEIVKTTNPSYIYTTTLTIQVTIGEDVLNNYDQYKNVINSLYFEGESTNTTVFFYNDLQNLNVQYCLKMYKVRNSTRLIEQTYIGQDCSTGSSDSLTFTLTNIRIGDLYLALGSYFPEGEEQILSQLYISFADEEINTGREGLWLQILLTLFIMMFSFAIIEAIPITIVVSLILGNLLYLNSLNIYMLFGLLTLAIMITYGIVQLRKS